jgi:hypothetical protein
VLRFIIEFPSFKDMLLGEGELSFTSRALVNREGFIQS